MAISGQNTLRYPFGAADVQTKAYGPTIAVTIKNSETIVKVGVLTGASTINLIIDPEVTVGSNLTIELEADTTARTVTFGTGMSAAAYQVGISKKVATTFKFTGSTFVKVGTQVLN